MAENSPGDVVEQGGTDASLARDARRTSSERLAETRARLLDAVLETLAERGYAGTSTTEVARHSGLTRGAQLHHFGTKDLMMVAAVEYLGHQIRAVDVEGGLAQVPPAERLRVALTIMTQLFGGTLAQAYVELWMASRTLPELADALKQTEAAAREALRSLFGEQLLERAGPDFEALLDFTLYAFRGMALDAHLADDAERRTRADLIRKLEPYFQQTLGEQP